ncbi:MAG: hypothetical protein SGI77_04160, partial [Pirellulaceae bacterium]|nr:hypothetical protein [Pirellulaceae bacterium]
IHNGITEPTQTINLASGTFGFVDIGTYFFSGTPGELIRLSQGTPVGILRADAVRFNRLSIANATPSIFTPTTQSLTGNTPHIFSTANNNAISVADIDAGIAQVQLALATTNGLLTLPSTVGLAFSSGANGLAAFTVSGTLASLNAALNGLRYSPSLNFSGYASISLTLNDLGNTGLGGVKSAVRSISLSVGSPDFIVDNSDAGYSETVAWVNSALTGFNGSSTRIAGAANAAATWNAPSLAPGYYTVSIYKVAVLSNSASANLTVIHNGITEPMQTINLASGTSGFVEIGTYFFSGAPGELVRLSKGTTVGNLRSDAVRFTLPGFTTFGYGYSSKWGSPVHGTASDVITWTFMNDGTSLHSSHPLSAEVSGLSNISQLRNSIDSTYGNGTFIETIQNAFNTWSAAAPGRINFQYVPTDTGAPGGDSSNPDSYAVDIRIGAFTAVPNSPFSYSAGVGFGPPGDDLNPFYHDALAGDITLNLSVPFFIAPGQEDDVFYTGGVYQNDLEGLMLHELGHAAIGLGHPTFGIGSVMYVDSFPDCCNFINRRLSAADIAGARTVYGFI